MASTTHPDPSTATHVDQVDELDVEHDDDDHDGVDQIDDVDGVEDGAAAVRAERRPRRTKRLVLVAAAVGAAAWMATAMLGGGDSSGPAATGAVPADVDLDAPPLPRAEVPAGCEVADADLVTKLVASTVIDGGGGVDNPFVADVAGGGDVERLVSARILGGDTRGELGLWGVTADGGIVALDEHAIDVSGSESASASPDMTATAQSDAADAVAKCTKAATGG